MSEMGRMFRIASLVSLLLNYAAGSTFAAGDQTSDRPTRCADPGQGSPVAFNIAAMRSALKDLTGWEAASWKLPRIDQLLPEAFEARTELDRRRFLGEYEAKTNRVFINLDCRCQVPDHAESFCEAVLFHELVHWGQHQSGLDKKLSGAEQERQALEFEIKYLQTRLGLLDVYPPAPPTRAELPPLERRVRLTKRSPRVFVRDAAGKRHWLWMVTGSWSEIPSMKDYQGQALYHQGHWVGVEIFEMSPLTGTEQVEAWWDAGYIRADRSFPENPVYEGRWVRIK